MRTSLRISFKHILISLTSVTVLLFMLCDHKDRGFKSSSIYGCMSTFFCGMLSWGLAMGRSPIQGVLPKCWDGHLVSAVRSDSDHTVQHLTPKLRLLSLLSHRLSWSLCITEVLSHYSTAFRQHLTTLVTQNPVVALTVTLCFQYLYLTQPLRVAHNDVTSCCLSATFVLQITDQVVFKIL
jgi:hypothetical protein